MAKRELWENMKLVDLCFYPLQLKAGHQALDANMDIILQQNPLLFIYLLFITLCS